MSAKRVLVTGARGLIGRHCLGPLQSLGYEVHAVTSSATVPPGGTVEWHQADLLAAGPTRALVARVRPTHCLHLAWIATPGVYTHAVDNLRWAAAGPPLVEALVEHGVRRIVAAGTCAEYGAPDTACDERSTPPMPATLYAAAKHAWHLAYDALARSAGIDAAWARIFLLYGPGEDPQRLVPSVIRALLRGDIAQCSAGTQVRDFLYVKDMAGALVALVDGNIGGSVNIGSGNGISIRDLVLAIARRLERPDLVRFGAPADEPPRLVAATSRLANEVGWRPRYDLETGLAETVEWWKDQA